MFEVRNVNYLLIRLKTFLFVSRSYCHKLDHLKWKKQCPKAKDGKT